MKLILLLYLEEDGPVVTKLMSDQGIGAYSRVSVEGRGAGTVGGWFGEVAPYDSKIILTVVTEEQAQPFLAAVEATEPQDVNHPVHAAMIDLEAWVHSQRP